MNKCPKTGLPLGDAPAPLRFEHFPTRLQTFVWRNWGIMPVDKLAGILRTTENNIEKLAEDMGLPAVPGIDPRWRTHGYMTLIRINWHLLPYEQLMELLDWSVPQMESVLKEDDFLWNKLGRLKPAAKPLHYCPLSPEEETATLKLKAVVRKYLRPEHFSFKPFTFDFSDGDKISLDMEKQNQTFNTKMIHAYNGIYGDPLSDSRLSSFPDELLKSYQRRGINAVWIHVVLHQLTLSPVPELSNGYQERIRNLQQLVARCSRYGIKVFLYLNEPRTIPEKYLPDFRYMASIYHLNSNSFGLCTSNPQVQEYLKNSVREVFEQVPSLGGAMLISMSENPTSCASHLRHEECPVCTKRRPEEIVVEVNRIIAESIHAAAPKARVIVNTWAWLDKWQEAAVRLLPNDVELLCVSEWGLESDCHGIKGTVVDYSISHPGPARAARELWRIARERGMKIWAKIQINNSWECSAVPFIPAVNLIKRHLDNIKSCGVENLMLSWSLGGWPSPNLELLSHSPEEIARQRFGDDAEKVIEAWRLFSEAFSRFPLSGTRTIYNGPQNAGPANLFYLKPTGYQGTMVSYSYDDLEYWRSIFPVDVFEKAFREMSEIWARGLAVLEDVDCGEQKTVAQAMYCHLKSSYNQIVLIRNRENYATDDSVRQRLLELLEDEIELTRKLIELQNADSRIGYEASNHYYYTPGLLMEKILNCEYLKTICT